MPWKKITQTEVDLDDPETMQEEMWDDEPEPEWVGGVGQVPCNRCNGVGSFYNSDGSIDPCDAEGCRNGYVRADAEQ